MSRIKRQRVFGWNIDISREHAFGECAAVFVLEFLSDAAELVYETSHAGVCRAHHRVPRLDATKDRVGQMLLRSGGMEEPAVVRDVDEKIGAALEYKFSRQIAHRVFETN